MFQERKNNFFFFSVVLLVCFLFSLGVRFEQFKSWEKKPHLFFVGDRPMMTTLDAPYWLRWAREYNEGTLGVDSLRDYPKSLINDMDKIKYSPKNNNQENNPNISEIPKIKYRDVPLLSFLIAKIAPFLNYNYYLTGTLIIPTLASLFILPLGIYFFKIGIPLSGLLGGLIGTFALAYFSRSSIGRIDTDMLNLFYPLLAGLMILLASLAKTNKAVLIYSAFAGISLYLFQWWYAKTGFTLIYFSVLIISLFIHKIRFHIILLSALLFLLFVDGAAFRSGAGSIQGFLKGYFTFETVEVVGEIQNEKENAPATFPKTMSTISEVDRVSTEQVFKRILSKVFLCWVGFAGLLGLMLFRWRVMLPLAPMIALGLLSFQSSNRFIMYLAPLIGVGLGWILNLGIEGFIYFLQKHVKSKRQEVSNNDNQRSNNSSDLISRKNVKHTNRKIDDIKNKISNFLRKISILNSFFFSTLGNIYKKVKEYQFKWFGISKVKNVDYWEWTRQVFLYLVMGCFFWVISSQTAISFVPYPSIDPRIYTTFLEIKKKVPNNSVLLTWWDYGYALVDATGLATFHDGGSQHSPKTYFIARGLISHNQDELYDITKYLATEGNRGIFKHNTLPEALLEAVRNNSKKPQHPIYLFFTSDMNGKYGAISKLGSWDIVNGGSKPNFYQKLKCNKITREEMSCMGAHIDLKNGKINNQINLRRLVLIQNGKTIKNQGFGHKQGFTLQLLVSGTHIVEAHLINESVYLSNYNQMFLMGKYKEDLYEETYNAFPFSRLFKFKF